MLEVYKFNTQEQGVFFSTDWHLGHKQPFVWQKRGFLSVEEHDLGVIDSVNKTVKENDILFYLGDATLNTQEEKFLEYFSKINCKRIYMLWGNHNNPSQKIYRKEVSKVLGDYREIYPFFFKNIIFVGNHWEIVVDNKYIVLNHFPLLSWNSMTHGSYMLCGHEHGGLGNINPDNTDGLILDVAFDTFKKPLSFKEVSAVMEQKKVRNLGHH
jgi:calcineurin-like phosphoesterase family protein